MANNSSNEQSIRPKKCRNFLTSFNGLSSGIVVISQKSVNSIKIFVCFKFTAVESHMMCVINNTIENPLETIFTPYLRNDGSKPKKYVIPDWAETHRWKSWFEENQSTKNYECCIHHIRILQVRVHFISSPHITFVYRCILYHLDL